MHVARLEKSQVAYPICARVCARDAAGQTETGEMPTFNTNAVSAVKRGQRDGLGQPGAPETLVVWLITQRSRVQIRPRYEDAVQRPFPDKERASGMWFVHRMLAVTPVGPEGQRLGLRLVSLSSGLVIL